MSLYDNDSMRPTGSRELAARSAPELAVLKHTNLFIGVDDLFIRKMLSAMQRASLPRGYVMNMESEVRRRFHIILSGRIKIGRHHLESGREVTLLLLGPGEGFNILNLLDGAGTHDLQTQAIDSVELLWAPVERWLTWMDITMRWAGQWPTSRRPVLNIFAIWPASLRSKVR